MSASVTDWAAWHDAYRDPTSALTRRLEVVRDQIRSTLPARPRKPFQVLSLCAGRGDDLIAVLSGYAHAAAVRARLIERDPRNVRALARSARAARLELEIVEGDAADPKCYDGAVPGAELAFIAPEDELFSVGACRFLGEPRPLGSARLVTFIR